MKKFRKWLNTNAAKHPFIFGLIIGTIIMISSLSITASLQGCQSYTDSQGQEVVRLTDEAVDVLDKGAELAPVVSEALVGVSIAFPALAGLLGITAGAVSAFFGAYKKYRPQITKEQDKALQAGTMTRALVYAIEDFKKNDNENWDSLKQWLSAELGEMVGPEALAVIATLVEEYYEEGK